MPLRPVSDWINDLDAEDGSRDARRLKEFHEEAQKAIDEAVGSARDSVGRAYQKTIDGLRTELEAHRIMGLATKKTYSEMERRLQDEKAAHATQKQLTYAADRRTDEAKRVAESLRTALIAAGFKYVNEAHEDEAESSWRWIAPPKEQPAAPFPGCWLCDLGMTGVNRKVFPAMTHIEMGYNIIGFASTVAEMKAFLDGTFKP